MLIDFTTQLSDVSFPRLVIVGSGPVGMALATGLRRRGVDVTIIESGPAAATSVSPLNEGDNLGLPFTGIEKRGRGLGGGTSQWAGQCLRFHAADFERREWVDGSGWPLGYDDLAPFYSEAEKYFDVSADGYLARVWEEFGLEPGRMIDTDVLVRFSVFARQPQVFDRDRKYWSRDKGSRFLYNATVTQLVRDGPRVRGVVVQHPGGAALTIPADLVVICVGGIETARMLLEPTPGFPRGIGNGNPHVGQHFQDHPHTVIGQIEEYELGSGLADVTRFMSALYRSRRRYLPRLVLSATRQRELGVLNSCAIATFDWPPESVTQNLRELQAAVAGRRFDLRLGSRISRTVRDPWALSRSIRARLRGASFGEEPALVNLHGFAEQDPMTPSSVSLSDRSDCLGRPLAAVNWQVGDRERETLLALAHEIDAYLRSNGIGRVQISESLKQSDDRWKSGVLDNQHHVGTARMSDSEHRGVVDPNCRLFGLPNLYVCGGAVMPTGSHANPTLTMTALAFRLASRLAKVSRAPLSR